MISIGKQNFFIIEVHLIIKPQKWSFALHDLQKRLKEAHENRLSTSLIPLYYSCDIEDLEVRICFLYTDVQVVERYIVDSLRSVDGVTATRVRLTLKGEIFSGGFEALMLPQKDFFSSHIFIKVDPVRDYSVWCELKKLPRLGSVYPTWIFRDFYEYDRDVTLRVIGKTIAQIRDYIEENINTIEGVLSWKFKIMQEFTLFSDKAFLTEIATLFLSKPKTT